MAAEWKSEWFVMMLPGYQKRYLKQLIAYFENEDIQPPEIPENIGTYTVDPVLESKCEQ